MAKVDIISRELSENPGVYGSLTNSQIVDELNAVDKLRNKRAIRREDFYELIEPSALSGLTAVQLAQLNLSLSDTMDPFGNAAQVLINIFGGGSQTVSNLQSFRRETVSRAAVLGISKVRLGEVIEARR